MDSLGGKVENDNERQLLSFSEIATRLRANQSEKIILDILIKRDIECYIQIPPRKKLYVNIFKRNNDRISPAFEMGFQEDNLERLYRIKKENEFAHPIELTDPYLLLLDKKNLQHLLFNAFSFPTIFNGALKVDLEKYYFADQNGYHDIFFYCPVEMQRYAMASADEYIGVRKEYSFTEGVKIKPLDIIIFERDFHKIKSVYFDENIKKTLCVSNLYVSILNFAAFEYYDCNSEREYKSDDVRVLLKKERDEYDRGKDLIGDRELERSAAIINRTNNPNQGIRSDSQSGNKLEFTDEVESYRKQSYFSDHLTLVNYLAHYTCKGVNKRQELECVAKSYGLSKSLAEMVVKLIMRKPS